MTEHEFYTDPDGIKYKYPERSCKSCAKYPCFRGQESFESDMAKYGCVKYVETIIMVKRKHGN